MSTLMGEEIKEGRGQKLSMPAVLGTVIRLLAICAFVLKLAVRVDAASFLIPVHALSPRSLLPITKWLEVGIPRSVFSLGDRKGLIRPLCLQLCLRYWWRGVNGRASVV